MTKEFAVSKLIKCKSCGNEIAKSAKSCPSCGAKQKWSMTKRLMFAVPLFLFGIYLLSDNANEATKPSPFEGLETAQPSDISPHGELANIFNLMSEHTDIQRDNKLEEIKGRVVEWELRVYEISKNGDIYRITCAGTERTVGVMAEVKSTDYAQQKYIEGLRTGDLVKIKGRVTGLFMRQIKLAGIVTSG